MQRHRLAFGSIATAHLAAAGGTAYAGAPIAATPSMLAAAGVVAVVLGVTGPPDAADRRPGTAADPRRARKDRYRMGRLEGTGRSVDPEQPRPDPYPAVRERLW